MLQYAPEGLTEQANPMLDDVVPVSDKVLGAGQAGFLRTSLLMVL
jgi:hypothetical protein